MKETLLIMPNGKKLYCVMSVAGIVALSFLLLSIVVISYHQRIAHDGQSISVNLSEAISRQWISASGNIKSIELVDDELVVIGDGRLTMQADHFPFKVGRDYKIIAEFELEQLGYRTYATILLTQTRDNRIWQLANSDDIAWQKNAAKKVAIQFHWSEDLLSSSVVLLGYDRLAYEKTKNPPMIWRVKRISIIEADNGTLNLSGYMKYMAYGCVVIGLLMLWLTGSRAGREVKENSLRAIVNPLNYITIFCGIMVLIGVGVIYSFPIEALRLRADAWSYDIVARSIAGGLGFKANNIVELTSYPMIPLYYAAVYKTLGVSVVSVFWGNIFLLIASWISIAYCSLRFSRVRALASLAILAVYIPIWVSTTWTLSETLAMLMLTWVVIVAGKIIDSNSYIFWKSALLGLLLGLSSLTRTDFYGLVPLLLVYFFVRLRFKTAAKISVIVVMVVSVTVCPWWIFQANNKQNIIENNYWVSDLQRLNSAFENLIHRKDHKSNREVGIEIFSSNLIGMIRHPYDKYVIETEPNRLVKYMPSVKFFHLLFLIGTTLLVTVIWRKRPLFLIGIPEVIILIVISRTIILSALHDSPRYFSHNSMIIAMLGAMLFAMCYEEWGAIYSPRRFLASKKANDLSQSDNRN